MADAGKTRGLTAERWLDVRKDFEAGVSEAALALKYGVDRKTIRSRKRAEHWIPQVTPQMGSEESKVVHESARAQVIDIATGRALETLEKNGTIDAVADAITNDLGRHSAISAKLMAVADSLLDAFLAGEDLGSVREQDGRTLIVTQGRIEQFAQLSTGIKGAVNVSRDINGLKTGQSSVASGESNAPRRFIFVPPKPKPAPIVEEVS